MNHISIPSIPSVPFRFIQSLPRNLQIHAVPLLQLSCQSPASCRLASPDRRVSDDQEAWQQRLPEIGLEIFSTQRSPRSLLIVASNNHPASFQVRARGSGDQQSQNPAGCVDDSSHACFTVSRCRNKPAYPVAIALPPLWITPLRHTVAISLLSFALFRSLHPLPILPAASHVGIAKS